MWSFTSGSFSHWIWEAGGRFTILSSVAKSIPCFLYRLVCRLLAPPTLGIGIIWFGSTFTRERSAIYMGSLFYSSLLFFSTFNASNSEYIDSHTVHRMLKVCIVFALFMGYLVRSGGARIFNKRVQNLKK
ncbi:hypothetical protein KY290_001230 [Solanum tuberosum]|uniref:Uncharacterized protein n=1 Tax=Solanum tuberosum TaxID=4113 RepID=A0ABQ7WLK6_SOLTU|nr:hypothetical protein KY289_001369 [Solanum tuberosum]KAH0781632.1 hypothetical protein KY290_001230 [Solanum tuberosum]